MTAQELHNRSERQFATTLDSRGIPWVYEPRFFPFARKRYTPDFYLPIQDEYVEVIGTKQRWYQLRHKLEVFRQHWPNVSLRVVGADGSPWLAKRGEADCWKPAPYRNRLGIHRLRCGATRKALRMTQAQLARVVGMGVKDIIEIEGRRRIPNASQAKRLAKALGLRVDELTADAEQGRA